jgi:cob(I)alamin adenosyltransferase|tara:strand:+ start:49 stop:576 length:528 start_codon:yes stop_codon:yes gene_type:complete
MKLYTRTGDDGTTGTVGDGRIEKDSLRMHAIGCVDELNAAIGLVGADELQPLQSLLFELGAELASKQDNTNRITTKDIENIEKWIDRVEKENLPLNSFILPGGSNHARQLHFARTVCRRAERSVLSLCRTEDCSIDTLVFLNRTGDLLFAMARHANKTEGVGDIPWQPRKNEDEK